MCLFGKNADDHDILQTSKYQTRSSMRDPSIVIVGAGAAGIACAVKLLQSFEHVQILEANDRIGGRIHTIPFADNVIDLGAQWCHGETGNVVYELVQDLKLLDTSGDIYVTFQCIRSDGQIIDEKIISRLKEILAKIFFGSKSNLHSFNGSLGEYLAIHYYDALDDPAYKDIDSNIAKEFFENFVRLESCESAVGIDEVSAKSFDEYWECSGDYLLNWKDKGYRQFLKVLTRADSGKHETDVGILEGKIRFGTVVEKIAYDRTDARVEIVCENKENLIADHVIVTVSLGVLKETYNTMFVPPLPPEKQRAIQYTGFGNVGKIFVEFESAFWPDNWTGFNTLWCDFDIEMIRLNNHEWIQDIYGIYCVNYQPRVLVAWCVGKSAKHIEFLTKDELKYHILFLLKKFLPNYIITEIKNIIATTWSQNPFYRGAYSFRSLHTERHKTGAMTLSQPISVLTNVINDVPADSDSTQALTIKPVVLFAGEATSEHYYSTVHGAVETGFREARRLLGYYYIQT